MQCCVEGIGKGEGVNLEAAKALLGKRKRSGEEGNDDE
jgi:hypothetical protein